MTKGQHAGIPVLLGTWNLLFVIQLLLSACYPGFSIYIIAPASSRITHEPLR